MLMIPTRLAPSTIHGTGVFTTGFVRKGTLIWKYDPLLDRILRLDEILRQPEPVRNMLAVYMYEHLQQPGHYVWCGDDARYFNHSLTPTTVDHEGCDYAAQDLRPGTEITSDYACFGATIEPNDWQAEAVRHAHLLVAWASAGLVPTRFNGAGHHAPA